MSSIEVAETGPDRDGVALIDARWKVLKTETGGYADFGWQVRIKSSRQRACEVRVEFTLLDGDGFQVEDDNESVFVPPGAEVPLTGRVTVEGAMPLVARVNIDQVYDA